MRYATLILVMLAVTLGYGQQHTEKINKSLRFEKSSPENTLIVSNISGRINVEGYDGNEIIVEVEKIISAKSDERLALGKTQVQLGVIDDADTLILYVNDGCNKFTKNDRSFRNWNNQGWGYNGDCEDKDCNNRYDYKMHFTVKVPRAINVVVSTINNGNIDVRNVHGAVKAANINGAIDLADLQREAIATTINGDVNVDYTKNPGKDCRFYSLNGDINANFPKGLSAELTFESFNGDFYTNVSNLEQVAVRVVKNERKNGTRYKINGNRYQVGDGGVYLDFETFNGNVYLKEK